MQANLQEKIAIKTSIVTIVLNFMLTIFKFVAGILGNSLAMISDAIHSASDVFSTIIVIIGVKISAKAPDKNHEFGHERFECVAAIVLAVVLCATGVMIGYGGISNIVSGAYKSFEKPQVIALVAAIVSIVVKEGMFWYTRAAAIKADSSALRADAWHHRSDSLSSIGSLIGIVGAMFGVLILDSIASIVICLLIIKASVDIFMDAVKKMTDQACDEKTEGELRNFVLSCDGVLRVDELLTRLFGNRIYVIAEISCNKDLPLYAAHAIAEKVHSGIEQNFPQVKHITVHVNPYYPKGEEVKEEVDLNNNSSDDDNLNDGDDDYSDTNKSD
jgi:cation diffusion facilitator family transporter